jgi:hypothetical protein
LSRILPFFLRANVISCIHIRREYRVLYLCHFVASNICETI